MKQVREIGYDAEDRIDIFLHHLSKHSGDNRGLARQVYKILMGALVPKNFHFEICAFFFGHMHRVLNVVKQ